VPHPCGYQECGFDSSSVREFRRCTTLSTGRGDLHFITFGCYRRLPCLGLLRHAIFFVKILDVVRLTHRFLLLGYVVLLENIHLLISEPEKGDPSRVLQALKQRMSIAMSPRFEKKSKARPTLSLINTPAFWQRRFYDFNVWTGQKVNEKLQYKHANPIKRKLVPHPRDFPWSSWSHYENGKKGLIRIDRLVWRERCFQTATKVKTGTLKTARGGTRPFGLRKSRAFPLLVSSGIDHSVLHTHAQICTEFPCEFD
jgi:putative transposase